jgi:hypothetical protein
MIFNGATLYYHRNDLPAFLVITAACVMMLVDTVLRKPYSKTVFNDFFFMILTTAVMLAGFCMFLFIDTTQLLEENEEMIFYEIASVSTIVSVMASHIAIECNTGFIRTTYPAYRHFMKGEKKIGLRKKSVVKSVIAVVLAFGIFCGATFAFSIYVRKQTLDELRASMTGTTYKDYDKSDVVFSDEEKTTVVEYGDFTIKLPAEFKEKEKDYETVSKAYYGQKEKAGVFLNEYVNVTEAFEEGSSAAVGGNKEKQDSLEKIQKAVEEKYGFYPKTMFEWKKLERLVYENDEINYFSREDMMVEMYLSSFSVIASLSESTNIICEDNEKQIYITSYRPPNSKSPRTLYVIDGNKTGDVNKGVNIMVFVTDEYSDPDVMYKIINSIEFK